MPPPGACPSCTQVNQMRNDLAALDDLDQVGRQTEVRSSPTNERTSSAPSAVRENTAVAANKNQEAQKDAFVRNETPARQLFATQGERRAQNPELRAPQPETMRVSLSRSSSESAQHVSRQSSAPQVSRENLSNRPQLSASQNVNPNSQGSVVRQEAVSAPKFSGQSSNANPNSAFSLSSASSFLNPGSGNSTSGTLTSRAVSQEFTSLKASTLSIPGEIHSSVGGVNPRSSFSSFMQGVSNVLVGKSFGFVLPSLGNLGVVLPFSGVKGDLRLFQLISVKGTVASSTPVGGMQGGFSLSSFSALKRLESHMMQFARLLMGSYMFLKPGLTAKQETYLEGALYMEEEVEDREEVLSEEEMLKRVRHKRDAYFGSNAQQHKG